MGRDKSVDTFKADFSFDKVDTPHAVNGAAKGGAGSDYDGGDVFLRTDWDAKNVGKWTGCYQNQKRRRTTIAPKL